MAESPADMQAMFDCLRDFCEATKLTVSIKKTEVVVFNKQVCDEARVEPDYKFVYDGTQLSTKLSFIYLGSLIVDGDSSSRTKAAFSRVFTKAQKAHHMLRRRCHVMEIFSIDILTHLFDSLVQPVLNFGCEVWAPSINSEQHTYHK